MGERCWRLTWPARSDRLLNMEPQLAHMQGKDGVGVDRETNGEEAWSRGENGESKGEDEAEEIEESEMRAWID